jgi:hypothetical protein
MTHSLFVAVCLAVIAICCVVASFNGWGAW